MRAPMLTGLMRCNVAFLLLATPAAVAAQEQAEHWTLVPDLRVGSVDAPDYALTWVSDLAIGPDGSMYLGQPMDGTIRVFDRTGAFVRQIGRKGNGPGEFQDVARIGWRADTLWAVDYSQGRVNLFTMAGELLETVRPQGPTIAISSRPTHPEALVRGGLLLGRPLIGDRPDVRSLPLLRMSRSGRLVGTLGNLLVQHGSKRIRTSRLTIVAKLPVQSNSLWRETPDGSAVVFVHRPPTDDESAGRFWVEKIGVDGDTLFRRQFRYVPKIVPAGVLDSIAERYGEFWSRALPRAEAIELARDSLPIPRFQAPVTALAVGRDGSIWLRREEFGVERVTWLVLAPNGRIRAELSAPAGLQILQADDGVVWGVEEDELEVPFMVRYRVNRGAPG